MLVPCLFRSNYSSSLHSALYVKTIFREPTLDAGVETAHVLVQRHGEESRNELLKVYLFHYQETLLAVKLKTGSAV
jgi:hypothetical protein